MTEPVKIHEVHNCEELIDALSPRSNHWQPYPSEWIFRGQWDSTFRLLPTAYRTDAWERFSLPGEPTFDPAAGYQSEIVQAQKEHAVLRRFLLALDEAGLDIPNDIFLRQLFPPGAPSGDPDFILDPAMSTFAALAQHHGLPTRLLDWTRSGLHAAYFASAQAARRHKEEGKLSVWALSLAFVEWTNTLEASPWKGLEHSPQVRLITAPRASNPNLHAQAGLFLAWFNATKVTPLEEIVAQIVSALDEEEDARWKGTSPLHRFDLPWSQAPQLLRLLAYEQVDATHMFPGTDGVVRGMKEHGLWDRKD